MRKILLAGLAVCGLLAFAALAGCAAAESNTDPPAVTAAGTRAEGVSLKAASFLNTVPCDHTFAAVQTVEPSCTEQGYTVYACTLCGQSYTDDFTPAKGHTMREIVVEPTCTHKGYTTHFCTVCGYEYSDAYREERGHKYVSELVEPTCTQAGYTLHTCSVCGDSYQDDYRQAVGHDYAEETAAPTCTGEGYTKQTCKTCGEEVTYDHVPALGHTYVQTTVMPTCVSYGYTEHRCSVCGDRYVTDYIGATGHMFLDVLVEATPEAIGYTRHICIVCDYSYISDYVTSGDTGYIEPPSPDHVHEYDLYVQDAPEEKYFIALRVCDCGASTVGNLSVTATDQNGAAVRLTVNEYGQADYSHLSGSYTVRIADESGQLLKEFPLTVQGAAQPPEEEPEDEPSETPTEEESEETGEDGGSSGTIVLLCLILIILAAGGAAAWLLIKKRKIRKRLCASALIDGTRRDQAITAVPLHRMLGACVYLF